MRKKVKLDETLTERQLEFIKKELSADLIKFKKEFGIDYTFKK